MTYFALFRPAEIRPAVSQPARSGPAVLSRRVLPVLALATSLAWTAVAEGGRVDDHVGQGETRTSAVTRPGGVRTVGFLVHAGEKRKLKLQVKRAKGSELALDVRLVAPDGSVVDVAGTEGGKLSASEKAWKAKLKSVDQAGLWRIEVRGADSTAGEFTVKAAASLTAKLKDTEIAAVGGAAEVPFEAGDGVNVTLTAKATRGSSLVPDIVVVDPAGRVVAASVGAALVSTKSKSAKLKKLVLPAHGTYVARFTGTGGTGGEFVYSIKTKAEKFKNAADASAGAAVSVEPGRTVELGGSVAGTATFHWVQVAGPEVELDDPFAAAPTFTAPDETASLAFELGARVGGVPTRPRLVGVEVGARPVAITGRNARAAVGGTHVLDSSSSIDPSGEGLAATWRVVAGDGTLDDPAAAAPTLTGPAGGGLVHVGLVVDDGTTESVEAQQLVQFSDTPVTLPDAGAAQVVSRMATVHLSGLASQRATGLLEDGTAQWVQTSGPLVTLDAANGFHPAFTAPRAASDLAFELRQDGAGSPAATTWVFVRDSASNTPPGAVASGAQVGASSSFTLDGTSSSDADGDTFEVRWAQSAGDVLTLSSPVGTTLTATSAAQAPFGTWSFVVQARDALAYGPPEIAQIVSPGFDSVPIADAGIDRVTSALQPVMLDGTGSTAIGGLSVPLQYEWTQLSGRDWYDVAAEDAGFDGAAEQPVVTLPPDLSSLTPRRSLTFALTVTDGATRSAPDVVTVSFTGIPLNGPPTVTAEADRLAPLPGQVVTLTATPNDRDGDPVTVEWSQFSGPLVSLAPSTDAEVVTFAAPASGVLVFDVVADDGFDASDPARVTVDVNEAPIAVATVDPTEGDPGTVVTFSASGSSDPEGEPLTFLWEQTEGSPLVFDSAAEEFSVTAPVGSIQFRLTVNDGAQDGAPVLVAFGGNPPPELAPSANFTSAGYGSSVSLSANPDGGDNVGVTFVWRQISGPTTTLSSTSAENPTFTVPLPTSAPFGGTQAALPSAVFGVTASRDGDTGTERSVTVTYFASYNSGSGPATTSTVWSIISGNCVSCHSGSARNCSSFGSGKLGLNSATNAYTNLVTNTASACTSSKRYVNPGNAGQSFMLDRLKGTPSPMPPGSSVGTTNINFVEDWIRQGAQNN